MNFEEILPLLWFLIFLEILHPNPRVFEFLLLISFGSEFYLKNQLTRGCLQPKTQLESISSLIVSYL